MGNKKILATISGREVSEQDLESFLDSLDPERAAYFNTEKGREQLLDNFIAQELIYLDAIKNGLDKNEAFVRESEKMHENLLKQFAVHGLLRDIVATEDESLNFYNENKHMFVEPETVKASHILVDGEEQAKEITKEINDGLSFEEAAKKYSHCPSNMKGGDLGYFSKGKMVPEFEIAAFGMEIGETSEPVKTQFGYHIIKLEDKKEKTAKSFDDVKDELIQQLTAIKQQKAYSDNANKLREEYEVIINE
ncbi:MAG TPA: peptidylprolyl isomerase [Oscillospiraceae bacterium]|nr:peptidylprolyl isomerase [Oscillospiraceae bacterium]